MRMAFAMAVAAGLAFDPALVWGQSADGPRPFSPQELRQLDGLDTGRFDHIRAGQRPPTDQTAMGPQSRRSRIVVQRRSDNNANEDRREQRETLESLRESLSGL